MSETTKQAGALPSADQAYQHLFDNVHAQVFFGTIGRRGFSPANEKEAQDLLELAGRLRTVKQAEKTSGDSRFAGALQALDAHLGQQVPRAQESEMSIKQAAAALLDDPAIYNSVLALKQHEAEQMAAGQPG